MARNDRIVFECPKCLGVVKAAPEAAGQRIVCSDCDASLLVPGVMLSDQFEDLFEEPLEVDPKSVAENASDFDSASNSEPNSEPDSEPDEMIVDDPFAFELGDLKLAGENQVSVSEDSDRDDVTLSDVIDEVVSEGFASSEDEQEEAGFDLQLAPLERDPIEEKDPFVVDDDAPIKIDGLGMEDTDDVFGLKCSICDTRIHVRRDQIGSGVECPVCFSEVKVTQPASQSSPSNPWSAPSQEPEGEDELTLEDPVEISDEDYGIKPDYGLEPVEKNLLQPIVDPNGEIVDLEVAYDDSIVDLEIVAEDEDKPKDKDEGDDIRLRRSGLLDDDELRLEDLPAEPTPESSRVSSSSDLETHATTAGEPVSDEEPTGRWREQVEAADSHTDSPVDSSADTDSPLDLDDSGVSLKQLSEWMQQVILNPQLSVRVLVSVVLFAIGFAFFDSFWASFGDKEAGVEPSVLGLIFYGFVGCLFWLPGAWLFSITFSVLFRDSSEREPNGTQWPELVFSEWSGPFAFTLVCFWASALPGFFVGNLLLIVSQIFLFLLLLVPISVFLLMPICLVSALYNESIVKVVAPDMIRTLSTEKSLWLRLYKTVSVLLGLFLLGTLLLYLPTIVFGLLGAIVQVIAASGLAAATGLHFAKVMERIH